MVRGWFNDRSNGRAWRSPREGAAAVHLGQVEPVRPGRPTRIEARGRAQADLEREHLPAAAGHGGWRGGACMVAPLGMGWVMMMIQGWMIW
jgi:hypothetical protein